MNQSYTIFVNNSTVFLCNNDALIPENAVVINQPNDAEIISNIEFLEKSINAYLVYFVHENVDFLFKKLSAILKVITAAGGFVTNDNNDVLMIFRRGKWDLPKGKVEKKESVEKAAIREVEEETGVNNVHLINHLLTTYHIYTLKDKKILKETHWYNMHCNSNKTLKPQLEEDITEVKWVKKEEVPSLLLVTYDNIKNLFSVRKYLN